LNYLRTAKPFTKRLEH